MLPGRGRVLLALTVVATLTAALVTASPSAAEPDIDEVETRVERLYRDAERAQERLHDARLELDRATDQLRSLRRQQARQQARVDTAQGRVEESVVDTYQGEGVATVAGVLAADDPAGFLDNLATVATYQQVQAERFDRHSSQVAGLQDREQAVRDRVSDIHELEDILVAEKAEVEDKAARAEDLLAELEAEERRRLAAAQGSTTVPESASDVEVSGSAAAAVSYALAQVGNSYVYGAAGPSAFDCSGLTMMAWAQAGVALPHSSSAQMGSGTPVSASELQPGDLVFYYSPVSHVGIYVGGGQVVNALNPSTGVQITSLHYMPFSGAVRPG